MLTMLRLTMKLELRVEQFRDAELKCRSLRDQAKELLHMDHDDHEQVKRQFDILYDEVVNQQQRETFFPDFFKVARWARDGLIDDVEDEPETFEALPGMSPRVSRELSEEAVALKRREQERRFDLSARDVAV